MVRLICALINIARPKSRAVHSRIFIVMNLVKLDIDTSAATNDLVAYASLEGYICLHRKFATRTSDAIDSFMHCSICSLELEVHSIGIYAHKSFSAFAVRLTSLHIFI